MKGRTIIVMMVLMLVTLIGLVVVQYTMSYRLRVLTAERFEQSARQAIGRTIHFIEEKESMRYVAEVITDSVDSVREELGALSGQMRYISPEERRNSGHGDYSVDRTVQIIRDVMVSDTVFARKILDDAAVRWVSDIKNKELSERLDLEEIGVVLSDHLGMVGINEPFEYMVYDKDGDIVYCSKLVVSSERVRRPSFVYEVPLFQRELNAGNAHIKVVFPTMRNERLSSNRAIWPSILIVLLVTLIFVYTTVTINRQRTIDEMKNDFINNMTHELKTPMASISLASEMLQDTNVAKTPNRIQSLSKIITKECNRLQMLIEKILQLAVYERGTSQLKLTDLSVNELVSSVCDTFDLSVAHVGGQLIRELDAQFDVALVDRVHFSNIIYNLLDNAVKYRSPDRPLLVYVRTNGNYEGQVQITVEDNGIGISRNDQKHIFEQFFRVHTGDRHDIKGYGIGLTYVKRMVDMHHGTISVSSDKNVGTRFTITLPVLSVR